MAFTLHRLDDWLLRELLLYLDAGDVYRLWVFAEEAGVDSLRDFLTLGLGDKGPLERHRAKHTAAAHACWTALLKLGKKSQSHGIVLSPRTVNRVIDELRSLDVQLAPHPDRKRAMLTVTAESSLPAYVMYAAARLGNLESVVWLHHVAQYGLAEALSVAGRNGHIHVVSWLLDRANGVEIAAEHNLSDDPILGIIAWHVKEPEAGTDRHFVLTRRWGFGTTRSLRTNVYPIVDLAATFGDLEGVQQLLAHKVFKDAFTVEAFENAAGMGHLDALKLLYQHSRDYFDEDRCLHIAAIEGQLHVVQWLVANNCGGVLRHQTYQQVIRNGHLDILQWMVNSFPASAAIHMDNSKVAVAARAGHTEIVKWLIEEEGYEVIRYHLSQAAGGGHMELVQWLLQFPRERGDGTVDYLFVDQGVLSMAAKSGNCALVRWLVEDQGIWSPDAMLNAVKSANVETIEYLFQVGDNRTRSTLIPGAQIYTRDWIDHRTFEALQCLLRLGYISGLLDKNRFDRLKPTERTYSSEQRSLGWIARSNDQVPSRNRSEFEMMKLRKMIRLVVEVYDPVFLRSIAWLPEWAVQHGTLSTLQRLADIQHTKIFSPATFGRLLRVSLDDHKVRWFLMERPSLCSTRVVQWAVKFNKRAFKDWFFEVFLTSQLDPELHKRCVRTAQCSMTKYGRRWPHPRPSHEEL